MVRIGLCDQHDLFRNSVESLLEKVKIFSISFSVATIEETITCLAIESTDILIIETSAMEDPDYVLLRKTIHDHPWLKVMVLTEEVHKHKLNLLLRCGITAYYSKSTSKKQFLVAVEKISSSSRQCDLLIGPIVREKLASTDILLESYTNKAGIELSNREIEILDLICAEKSNAEISSILGLSVRTVETHRRRMIEKTCSRNIVGVIIHAIQKGVPLNVLKAEPTNFMSEILSSKSFS